MTLLPKLGIMPKPRFPNIVLLVVAGLLQRAVVDVA